MIFFYFSILCVLYSLKIFIKFWACLVGDGLVGFFFSDIWFGVELNSVKLLWSLILLWQSSFLIWRLLIPFGLLVIKFYLFLVFLFGCSLLLQIRYQVLSFFSCWYGLVGFCVIWFGVELNYIQLLWSSVLFWNQFS